MTDQATGVRSILEVVAEGTDNVTDSADSTLADDSEYITDLALTELPTEPVSGPIPPVIDYSSSYAQASRRGPGGHVWEEGVGYGQVGYGPWGD